MASTCGAQARPVPQLTAYDGPLVRLALLAGAILALFPHWIVDDAYITLRYAHNLVEHGVLTWNVGAAPVEGYTGLLWTLLAAGAIRLGIDPVWSVQVACILSFFACLWLLPAVVAAAGGDQARQALALALFVTGPWWYVHAGSGLETMLFVALVLACVLAWLRFPSWLPLLCLLVSLTRPEGVVLALVLFGASWARGERHLLEWALIYGVPAVVYFRWRIGYYGELLPNTFHAKTSGITSWEQMVAATSMTLLLPLLACWKSGPTMALLKPLKNLVVACGVFCGVLFVVYGSSELLMNYAVRFYTPILALALVFLALTWGYIRSSSYLTGQAVMCALLLLGYGYWCYHYQLLEDTEHAPAAAWIQAHLPLDATLMVVVDAGLVPYRTGLTTIDVGALNDPYLARERDPQRRVDYLFAQKPDVILLADGNLGIVDGEKTRAALLADPRWPNYRLAISFARSGFDYHQQVWVRHGTSLH